MYYVTINLGKVSHDIKLEYIPRVNDILILPSISARVKVNCVFIYHNEENYIDYIELNSFKIIGK